MAEPTGKVQRLGENEQVENCRFYEQRYPSLEGFVMVRVKSISASAAYVQVWQIECAAGCVLLPNSYPTINPRNEHT